MFASRITSTVTVGETQIIIQKLSWKKLRDAQQANTDAALATAGRISPEMMKTFRELNADADKDKPELPGDRYKGYDREKVLLAGIKSWSDATRKVDPDSVGDLEDEAADAIFKAIIDLSVPPKEVAEARRGESFAASTVS